MAQDSAKPPEPNTHINFSDLTKSGLPIRFYGFVRVDAYYDTARFNSVIIPATVLPESETPFAGSAKPNDDQFAAEMRLTRFGFDILPVAVNGVDVKANLEIDFASFLTSNSRVLPRIRTAYIDLNKDRFGILIGQDEDTISPLISAVNHELVMWNAGNLGDRRLQFRGRYVSETVKLEAALGLTGAINDQDLDAGATPNGSSSELDGVDSGMPHLQVRAGFKPKLFAEKRAEIGIWGAFG